MKRNQKKIIIIHGWGGFPSKGWLKWISLELKKNGFKVIKPVMPNKDTPVISKWINHLDKVSGKIDENTYFIGHSIGCQAILRFLAKKKKKVGGVVFVAGWFHLKGLESKEEKNIARPWLNNKINFRNIKLGKSVAIFSDNDPFVHLKDAKTFKKRFNSKIIIQKRKGHFEENKTMKIPVLLKEILAMPKP